MGSDLYRVGLTRYHEWSKDKALQRAIEYGQPAKTAEEFFAAGGIWLELALSIKTIHPDVSVDWSASFVTRVIDEGVTAWDNKKKIDYKASPLHTQYPEIWEMRFAINKKNPPVVLVVQAEYHPDEHTKLKSYGKDDAVDLVVFIHQKYAPNLKDASGWDSRAWPGSDDPRPAPIERQRTMRAEVRALPYTTWLNDKGVHSFESNKWKTLAKPPRKGTYALSLDADGAPLLHDDESVYRVEKDWSGKELLHQKKSGKTGLGQTVVRDKEGTLWISGYSGLYRQDAKGNVSKLTTKDGLAGNNVDGLCLDDKGRLVVATAGGLSLHRGSKWENYKEGLADTKCRGVHLADDGALWTYGFHGVTRVAPDGTITAFKARQGIDGLVNAVIPLPGGGAWVATYNGFFEIAPGANKATLCDTLRRFAPNELVSWTRAGDSLWIASETSLFCLRDGQKPKGYRWTLPHPNEKEKAPRFWSIRSTPTGGLWVRYGNFYFLFDDFAKIDATAPINAEVCPISEVPVFSWPGSAKVSTAVAPKKSGIDLKGKTVVLTGTLSITREEAETKLKAKGATIVGSLSAKTNYLLAGAKAGSKLEKAKSLGVAILGEDALD
jgi:hypothetical protein